MAASAGDISATCRAALASVARERFIPDRCWAVERGGAVPLDRAAESGRWLAAVRSDVTIVTQYDDGATAWPEVGLRPTSSSSMPSVVAAMLDALDVRPGQSVLEIGTGSGYNAALLAELVGQRGQVSSVEIDSAVADAARERLVAAGYAERVRVLTADGASFRSGGQKWDRVIATAGVHVGRLPYGWVGDTRPGGIVLAPIRADFAAGPLVRFTVGGDGSATGRALAEKHVSFMEMRGQRVVLSRGDGLPGGEPPQLTHTTLDPELVLASADARWALALAMPGCRYTAVPLRAAPHIRVVTLTDPLTGSWASVYPAGDRFAVRHTGPRRLWDEAESAYQWWKRRGEPALADWEWTVGRDRQSVLLPAT